MLDMSVRDAEYSCQASMGRASQGELLQGTLPLLILRTLATGPNHGFAIARRIQQLSKSVLRVEQGSLYPALHRMELDGSIESYWGTTENNRKAKYYRLTRRGARELANETDRWKAIAGAIATILQEG
jgi:PadR family transcriptional regulator, regulatory protein PadR